MTDTADVVIIGAGVIGTSIAYHLAERQAGRILILDKGTVACAASGRSSSLVRMHYSFPPEVRLAVKSLEYFLHWEDWLGRPGHFRSTGFVRIVPRSESHLLEANVAMQQECGADARVLTSEELREVEPNWNVDDIGLAAYEPGSGYGDCATVATDFLDGARHRGAQYRPGTEVRALRVDAGRLVGVETDAGPIDAPTVVVAAGAWTQRLFRGVGIGLPLETEHHEVVILQRPPELGTSHAACIDSILKNYFRSEGQSQTLLGDFYGERGADPDEERPAPSLETIAEKVELLSRRIPAMADAGIVRTVAGTYTMTPDYRGLMGPISGVDGLYCCTGFSGMGFKIAPAVGLVMAELILDGKAKTVDISDFYPERFAEGKPVHVLHEYGDD